MLKLTCSMSTCPPPLLYAALSRPLTPLPVATGPAEVSQA